MRIKALFLVILLLIASLFIVACQEESGYTVDADSLTIAVGDNVLVPFSTKNDTKVTVTSSDPGIAKVVGDYVVGVKVGSTTLRLSDGNKISDIQVSVITSYNMQFVTVKFKIAAPDNNPNIQPYEKILQKKYYSSVNQSENTLLNDVPSVLDVWPDGYAFSGWKLDQQCTVDAVFPAQITTEDVIYYGKWIIRDGTTENDVNIQLDYDLRYDSGRAVATVEGFTYKDVPYETIVIPTQYVDSASSTTYEVVGIADDAFKNITTLKSVKMLSIEKIGNNAFSGCTNLDKITVSHVKLKSLGNQAFFDSGLAQIKTDTTASFDDFSLTNIGIDVFRNTPFIDSKTQATIGIWVNNQTETVQVYQGLLFAGNYLAYNYEYVSTKFDKTITLDNLAIQEVSCTFESDIKIVLLGYDNSSTLKDPTRIKQLFVEKGVNEENVEIVDDITP